MNLKKFLRYGIIDFIISKLFKKKCVLCGDQARIHEYDWFCSWCFIGEFDITNISDWWK